MAVRVIPEQLWLPRLEAASEPTDRLFFAIFPDDATAQRIAQIASNLKNKYRLRGEPLRPKRFHVSLYHLGNYFGFPAEVAARAVDAVSAITLSPFEVAGDRVMSFSGRHADTETGREYPLVLLANDGIDELTALRHGLSKAMVQAGLRSSQGRTQFTPHMALLYDERAGLEHAVETIRWTVREVVLVHSLLGKTRHIPLGRWPLAGRCPVQSVTAAKAKPAIAG